MRIASPRCSPVLPAHRPALLALVLAVASALAGCAGGRRAGHDDDRPAEHREDGAAGRDAHAPERSTQPEPVTKPAAEAAAGTGTLEVSVTWDDAPARLRRSPGRNACGASRPAPVQVHTLGGVAGAVVSLRRRADAPAPATRAEPPPTGEDSPAPAGAREDSPAPATSVEPPAPAGAGENSPAPATRAEPPPTGEDSPAPAALLALRQCRAWPRVVLLARPGDAVALVNDDERRHEIEIERLAAGLAVEPGKDAGSAGRVTATIALPVVGSSAELRWPAPGIYRVAAADVEAAFVIVPDGARAGVTTILGSVRFDDVPNGSYDVMAWHPSVDDDGAPITRQALVTVTAGQTNQMTIPLTWP